MVRSSQEAILGWLLRQAVTEDGEKAVFDGIALHAYHLNRDSGKDTARCASDAARAEARRLANHGASR